MAEAEYTGGTTAADHLCILVHGLWGNPNHMASTAKALRAEHPADRVHILIPKRNSGNSTYDGIELGGERVCVEIEEELEAIRSRSGRITKLSVVGYSLGGLVARYAIGLLHAKGALDGLECMTFTAFASPFLGVRSPKKGWTSRLFNSFGARTLSTSGRQLFTIDTFRDTGRPLLSVLADPNSIFMSGLRRFRRRTLYANIVNDRSAVYYTTGIAKTDPYTDLSLVSVNYADGYADVVLDREHPVAGHAAPGLAGHASSLGFLRAIPTVLGMAVLIPIGLAIYLGNAAVQSVNSAKRIRLHEKGLAGIDIKNYRVPLWIKEMREAVDDAYENLNGAQRPDYLGSGSGSGSGSGGSGGNSDSEGEVAVDDDETGAEKGAAAKNAGRQRLALERRMSRSEDPTLALAPCQFEMIDSLDGLGWRKYPVWIHKVRHSHAAIVVRWETKRFEEGNLVLRHWVKEEFLV